MTSLDHDQEHDTAANTANTNSDCDWDWDTGDWGDMEPQNFAGTISMTSSLTMAKSHHPSEQWTSLEEKPVRFFSVDLLLLLNTLIKIIFIFVSMQEEEAAEGQDKSETLDSGWDDDEFQPLEDFPPNEGGNINLIELA